MQVLIVQELGRADQAFFFSGPDCLVGRGQEVDLNLPSGAISSYHMRFRISIEAREVVDLCSRTGTQVDGEAVTRATIRPGAIIEIGPYALRYLGDENIQPVYGGQPVRALPLYEPRTREEGKFAVPVFIVRRDGRPDRVYPVHTEEVLVGREGDAHLRLRHRLVSRLHSRIDFRGEAPRLEDLESHNGTWLNGDQVEEAVLSEGDEIGIGSYVLCYLGRCGPDAVHEGHLIDSMPRYHAAVLESKGTGDTTLFLAEAELEQLQDQLPPEIVPVFVPILVVREKGHLDRTFPLYDDEVLVGRSEDAQLRLPNVSVSRRHARITRTRDAVHIEDLDSQNGVVLNGERVTDAVLAVGDAVQLGRYQIVFQGERTPGQGGGPTFRKPWSAARGMTLELSPEQVRALIRQESKPRRAACLVLEGEGVGEDGTWDVGEGVLGMGDGPDEVPVDAVGGAGRLAEVRWTGDGHSVHRLKFWVPIRVNGERVSESPLRLGDLVQVGRTRLRYIYAG